MANKKVENKDLINAVRNGENAEFLERIPQADGTNEKQIIERLIAYPTDKNLFITALVNKVGKSLFFNKVFNNPLKMLKKDLTEGGSIENIFVELAEKKGWSDNFSNSTNEEGDLIKVLAPKVQVDYAKQNFEYQFKASLSDQMLKTAFASRYGLISMLDSIVNSLYSSVEVHEYETIRNVLLNAEAIEGVGGLTLGVGVIPSIVAKASTDMLVPTTDSKSLAKAIRLHASKLKFPSDKYNLGGVKTWTNKEDLVLFATPEAIADLDVDVLAFAFNISSAEVPVRVIEVDDLGMAGDKKVKCLLADRELIQCLDTVKATSSFYNGVKLTTNLFAINHGVVAFCKFANSVVFTG